MIWGTVLEAQIHFFFLQVHQLHTDRSGGPTPALYNLAKLCKPFRYMECKSNKWDCEEGGGGGLFRGKFELLALTEMKLKGNRKVSWC